MTFRAVVFDFGGVLVHIADTPGRHKWELRLGLQPDELASMVFDSDVSHRAVLGLLPEIAIWQHIAIRYGLNDAALRQLEHDFWAGEFLDQDLIALLRSLRPQYKTAILSNAWSDARSMFVDKFALDQEVDTMLISAEQGIAKPDVRIYRLAAEQLGVLPQETVFVDDRRENIKGARAAGMEAVHFKDSAQTIEAIQTLLSESQSTTAISESVQLTDRPVDL